MMFFFERKQIRKILQFSRPGKSAGESVSSPDPKSKVGQVTNPTFGNKLWSPLGSPGEFFVQTYRYI